VFARDATAQWTGPIVVVPKQWSVKAVGRIGLLLDMKRWRWMTPPDLERCEAALRSLRSEQ